MNVLFKSKNHKSNLSNTVPATLIVFVPNGIQLEYYNNCISYQLVGWYNFYMNQQVSAMFLTGSVSVRDFDKKLVTSHRWFRSPLDHACISRNCRNIQRIGSQMMFIQWKFKMCLVENQANIIYHLSSMTKAGITIWYIFCLCFLTTYEKWHTRISTRAQHWLWLKTTSSIL